MLADPAVSSRLKASELIQLHTSAVADLPAIDALLDARFGPARHNRTAYRLRDGVAAIDELCLVARIGERLVGSVQCWPLHLRGPDGHCRRLVLLGPVAVDAGHERQGIGARMMQAVLERADAAGHAPQLLIGDAPYYGRFGFMAGAGEHWTLPGPVDRARLLLRGDASALPALGWLGPAVAAAA
jgi:predicted N-acetyltransferase YhbS